MDVLLNIEETVNGNLYIQEVVDSYATTEEEQFENDSVLFNESVSVTVLVQRNSETIIKAYINDHSGTEVSNVFEIVNDGWYTALHYIIPDKTWLDQAGDYIEKFERVFITDGGLLYEVIDGDLIEVDIETLMSNISTANIWKAEKDAFSLFNLWQCYLNKCKKLFNEECSKNSNCPDCDSDTMKEIKLLWMILNVIQYYIYFGEFEKAQEMLEMLTGCNGICQNEMFSKTYNCGC